MIGSQDDTGGKGVLQFSFPLRQGHLWARTRLLRAGPCQAPWKSPRMELTQPRWEPVAPVQPCPHQGKRIFLSLFWTSLLSVSASCYVLLWRPWLQLLSHCPIGVGECCELPFLSPLPSHLFPKPNKPSACSMSSRRKCSSPLSILGTLCWTCSILSLPFLSWGPQTGGSILDMP